MSIFSWLLKMASLAISEFFFAMDLKSFSFHVMLDLSSDALRSLAVRDLKDALNTSVRCLLAALEQIDLPLDEGAGGARCRTRDV